MPERRSRSCRRGIRARSTTRAPTRLRDAGRLERRVADSQNAVYPPKMQSTPDNDGHYRKRDKWFENPLGIDCDPDRVCHKLLHPSGPSGAMRCEHVVELGRNRPAAAVCTRPVEGATLVMPGVRTLTSLGVATLVSYLIHPAPANASTQRPDAVPMTLVDNRVFVHAKVDGNGSFEFLVDTGSSGTTVSPDLAKHLALPQVRDDHGGGAGEQQVSYPDVRVASVAVGSTSIGPIEAPTIDLRQLARVVGFQTFDGILGTEMFRRNVVTIDPVRRLLTIEAATSFQPPRDAVGIPVTIERVAAPDDNEDIPVFSGTVNGIAGTFEVDTGDRSGLTLYGPFWRAHQLDRTIGPTVTAMTGYGVGGPIRSIVGRPKSFTMAGLDVVAPVTRLSLQRSGSFTRSDYAGSIGMGVLKHFVVSFDYPHRMMWLVRGPGPGGADRYDRSGLWLGLTGDRDLEVVDVVAGGPAAQAGMLVGDRVDAINKVQAGPDTLFELRRLLSQPALPGVAVKAHRGKSRKTFQLVLRDQITPAG